MMNAPAAVDMKQLRELRVIPVPQELKYEETFKKLLAEAERIRAAEAAAAAMNTASAAPEQN